MDLQPHILVEQIRLHALTKSEASTFLAMEA
jgi:hypothetical protein